MGCRSSKSSARNVQKVRTQSSTHSQMLATTYSDDVVNCSTQKQPQTQQINHQNTEETVAVS